jgi:hypothetical protein
MRIIGFVGSTVGVLVGVVVVVGVGGIAAAVSVKFTAIV